MSKFLKSLIIGSVLSTVTPINFSSIGFSSSNINDNINDEEEIKIENKETKYDDVFAYAEKRGINLKTLRTDDNSGMLGPKYNGGSWNDATDLVYKLKINDKKFKSAEEAAEVRKCMATIIEYVSIGKKLDFSNGHEQMVKAIVAYMEAKDDKAGDIRNRKTAEATGVKYIAAAVAQEMLINLHKGRFLCALNENYKDACEKVEKELIEAQENNEWGTIDISKFSIKKTELVRNTIEQVFGSIPNGSSINNLSGKSYKYLTYLRSCVIAGMKKWLGDWKKLNGESKIVDRLQKAIDIQGIVSKALLMADNLRRDTKDVRKVRKEIEKIKNCCSPELGTNGNGITLKESELDSLSTWKNAVPFLRVSRSEYEQSKKDASRDTKTKLSNLTELLTKTKETRGKRTNRLISSNSVMEQLLGKIDFSNGSYWEIYGSQEIMASFSKLQQETLISKLEYGSGNGAYSSFLNNCPRIKAAKDLHDEMAKQPDDWQGASKVLKIMPDILQSLSSRGDYPKNWTVPASPKDWTYLDFSKILYVDSFRKSIREKIREKYKNNSDEYTKVDDDLTNIFKYSWALYMCLLELLDRGILRAPRQRKELQSIIDKQSLDDAYKTIVRAGYMVLLNNIAHSIESDSKSDKVELKGSPQKKLAEWGLEPKAYQELINAANMYRLYVGTLDWGLIGYLDYLLENYLKVFNLSDKEYDGKLHNLGAVRWVESINPEETNSSKADYCWLYISKDPSINAIDRGLEVCELGKDIKKSLGLDQTFEVFVKNEKEQILYKLHCVKPQTSK